MTADGEGVASHAGTLLLAEIADKVGLTRALSKAMAPTRQRRSAHDPGEVLRDLATMLADGGDCLADLSALRDQPDLFGRVASGPSAWRVIDSIDEAGLDRIRAARAMARSRAWYLGVAPKEQEVVLDFDATLITAHSEKEQAAPNYKHGFGFHPLLCYRDQGQEALAGVLRPGNAGSNTAGDHVAVLDAALAQLPVAAMETRTILARADSAGATHRFLDALRERNVRFSVGFDLTDAVRTAVLAMADKAWIPALSAGGEEREGAGVCELVDLDLSAWPEGSRVICRREHPHPGAQLTFTDHNGYRFQTFITDQTDDDIAYLEARHRGHARVEDRIRCAKDTGLRNFPFQGFKQNAVWLELVLMAQDLIAWAQVICLGGEAARWEPKTLRYRLWHVAARLVHTGRRLIMRLHRGWRWSTLLCEAFARLRALPPPA